MEGIYNRNSIHCQDLMLLVSKIRMKKKLTRKQFFILKGSPYTISSAILPPSSSAGIQTLHYNVSKINSNLFSLWTPSNKSK